MPELIGFRKPKVGFLGIGAQKSATTTLDHQLRCHPDIGMPEYKKELHYFDKFSRKEILWPRYARYESNWKTRGNKIYGEITPCYIYWAPCMRRIKRYNSKMKILILLRNPIDRAFSHWNMEVKRGNENLSFEEAIDREAYRLKQTRTGQHIFLSYLDRSRYKEQLRRVYKYFPKEQVQLIRYDSFIEDSNTELIKIFDFLRVRKDQFHFEPFKKHVGIYDGGMAPSTHSKMIEIFDSEIKALEKLTGWDCSSWYEQRTFPKDNQILKSEE